jgi:hypothetical protein
MNKPEHITRESLHIKRGVTFCSNSFADYQFQVEHSVTLKDYLYRDISDRPQDD